MKKKKLTHLPSPSKQEVDILAQKIKEKVEDNPKKAAIILTNWLKTSQKKKKSA